MGNEPSSPRNRHYDYDDETTVDGTVYSEMTRDTRDIHKSSSRSGRNGRSNNAMNGLIDSLCGGGTAFYEEDDDDSDYDKSRGRRDRDAKKKKKKKKSRGGSGSYESDGSYDSNDDRDLDSRDKKSSSTSNKKQVKSPLSDESFLSDDFNSKDSNQFNFNDNLKKSGSKEKEASFESATNSVQQTASGTGITFTKPLASSFAKRCYFTKAGIGKNAQHYEGVTLTGNTVLMLASAMKLKGCPTICDEDLRRVEKTYPNQFSRLPDELLLSSGWRRVSKYCHFSGKPIADGVPFFHSRDRCHPTGGYYFLLAASIGMERPSDVEPLTLDMLILLQTDYPTQCDSCPKKLVDDPTQWTLVTRFCFFSGGPINSDEDVYYTADFDGNPIYMLAFLSPNMTPEELYRLNDITGENALKSVAAVEEVESVYNLTERDFDDLKMYHLGPCRALPNFLLTPDAWLKLLPKYFMECRENALARAFEYEVHAQEAIAKAGKTVGKGFHSPHSSNLQQQHSEQSHASLNLQQHHSHTSNLQHSLSQQEQEYGGSGVASVNPSPSSRPTSSVTNVQSNSMNGNVNNGKGTGAAFTQSQEHHLYNGLQYGSDLQSNDEKSYGRSNNYQMDQHQQEQQSQMMMNGNGDGQSHAHEGSFHAGSGSGGGSYAVSHHDSKINGSTGIRHTQGPYEGEYLGSMLKSGASHHSQQMGGGASYHSQQMGGGASHHSQQMGGGASNHSQQMGGAASHHSQQMGGGSHYEEMSYNNSNRSHLRTPQSDNGGIDEDPTIGDPTVGGDPETNHHGDDDEPTIRDEMTHAEDPTIRDEIMTHAEEPTIRDEIINVEDPTIKDEIAHLDEERTDSQERALDDYYRGIKQQFGDFDGKEEGDNVTEFNADDEFPDDTVELQSTVLSENQRSFQRASTDDGSVLDGQVHGQKLSYSSKDPDDNDDPDELASTASPPRSEYVSMQELGNPCLPEMSSFQKTEDEDDDVNPPENEYVNESEPEPEPSLSPPTTPPRNEPEPTRVSTFAGYSMAKQFSTGIRPTTPKHYPLTPPRLGFPPARDPSVPISYKDQQSVEDDVPDDEPSLCVPPESPLSYQSSEPLSRENVEQINISSSSTMAKPLMTADKYSKGSAMRGARELLKKNRQERLAVMSKRRGAKSPLVKNKKEDSSEQQPQPQDNNNENKAPEKSRPLYSKSRSRTVTPNKKRFQTPTSPTKSSAPPTPSSPSKEALASSSTPEYPIPPRTPDNSSRVNTSIKSPGATSDVSGTSSVWTDSSDKDSRRALILKMAKSRMRSKKEMVKSSEIEVD